MGSWLQATGLVVVAAGIGFIYWPAGVVAGGVGLILVGLSFRGGGE